MSKGKQTPAVEALGDLGRASAPVAAKSLGDLCRDAAFMATANEPAWVGWVYRLAGKDGYQRCKVRIPLSMLDDVRVGLPTGPDLRSNLVAQQTAEATSDAFLMEMSRESQK